MLSVRYAAGLLQLVLLTEHMQTKVITSLAITPVLFNGEICF
jgi:hypothetical protein